eukprot:6597446-Prymnesium_polylepis.1
MSGNVVPTARSLRADRAAPPRAPRPRLAQRARLRARALGPAGNHCRRLTARAHRVAPTRRTRSGWAEYLCSRPTSPDCKKNDDFS